MTKKQLIEAIEAYAAAKATGNINLLQMSAHALKAVLDDIPESIGPTEEKTQPDTSNE